MKQELKCSSAQIDAWKEDRDKQFAELYASIARLKPDPFTTELVRIAERERMDFLRTYKRNKGTGSQYCHRIGNVYEGCIDLDVFLFLEWDKPDFVSFQEIYGVTVDIYKRYYQKYGELGQNFNYHGTVMSGAARNSSKRSDAFLRAFYAVLREVDALGESATTEEMREHYWNRKSPSVKRI